MNAMDNGSSQSPPPSAPPPLPPPVPPPTAAPEEEPQPFSTEEYAGVLLRPYRSIEFILGSKERLVRSVWDDRHVWRLATMLLAVSLLAAIPYGMVSPHGSFWKIAVLFCGSLAVCFPSLHTFAQFCGLRLDLGRSFALSLIITATASLFTFGFFPIIWFIQFSVVPTEATVVRPGDLSNLLLWISLALGLTQVGRCLAALNSRRRENASVGFLFLLWAPLLVFITYRMALLLELY